MRQEQLLHIQRARLTPIVALNNRVSELVRPMGSKPRIAALFTVFLRYTSPFIDSGRYHRHDDSIQKQVLNTEVSQISKGQLADASEKVSHAR